MGDVFTTREIATAFWLVAFAVWAATLPDVRHAFQGLVKAALQKKLVALFLCVLAYTAAIVLGLSAIRLWGLDLIKDTVLWLVFAGIGLAFSGIEPESSTAKWRRLLKGQLSAIVVVEFVVANYTFPLLVEVVLIFVLGLLAATLGVSQSYARKDPQYELTAKALGWVLNVIGLVMLAFAVKGALDSIGALNAARVTRQILLAPTLTAAFLPLVWAVGLLVAYDTMSMDLRINLSSEPRKDPEVIRYARRKLFAYLGLRLEDVREFDRRNKLALRKASTREEIDRLIEAYDSERRGQRGPIRRGA